MATTLLVVKCGSTSPAVRLAHGDYDRWFQRALGPAGVALRVVDVHAGAPLPRDTGEARGIVVTGSPCSVSERAPWMLRTAAWLLAQAEDGVPVLGVCFGHQLLAEAGGGRVARSPRGREIGSVACTLTAAGLADPLFAGVPARFEALATHEDEVVELPRSAVLLAGNGWSRVQAFGIGARVRCVQFHPELDPPTLAALVESRAAALAAQARARGEDGERAVETIRAGLRVAPAGPRILANFVAGLGAGDEAAPATPRPAASARRA